MVSYYVNGARVSSRAIYLSTSIILVILFTSFGSILTSFVAHIPVYIIANRLSRKSGIVLERKRKTAVFLWLVFGFNVHLIYLGLLDLFFLKNTILMLAFPFFYHLKLINASILTVVISLIWWLFDLFYIFKSTNKFYASHINWTK
jgi:hypothetical protein